MAVTVFSIFKKIWFSHKNIILLILIMANIGCNDKGADFVWLNHLPSAMAQARELDKPILIFFSATWCGNCRRLEKTAFRDGETVAKMSQFVLLKIDIDESPITAEQYGVQAVPMLLVMGYDGTPYNAIMGVQSPVSVRSFLNRSLGEYSEAMKQEESHE